jgi:hypothetical protein
MPEISASKVAYVILRAREVEAKVAPWDAPGDSSGIETILESRSGDATEDELRAFIGGLNEDEQANLVAILWVGRGDFDAAEFDEAVAQARAEGTVPTADYLLGEPLLADYLEDGLSALGFDPEAEEDELL